MCVFLGLTNLSYYIKMLCINVMVLFLLVWFMDLFFGKLMKIINMNCFCWLVFWQLGFKKLDLVIFFWFV